MIVSIDNLAQRYSLLPSQILAQASTFDMYVADVSTRYHNRQREINEGKLSKHHMNYTQDQLKSMIQAVRGAKDGSKKD